MRYSRACGSYQDFLDRGMLLTMKLLNQGFLLVKLKSSLRKTYGHHHDLVDRYGNSVSQMITDISHFPVISSLMNYHRVCNQINTTGFTTGARTAYPSGAPEFTPGFQWVRVTRSLVLYDRCLSFCTFSFGHCVVLCICKLFLHQ